MKTILTISVHPEKENPIFSEQAIHVSLADDAAGMFIVIKQYSEKEVRINPEEVDEVFEACKQLLAQKGI